MQAMATRYFNWKLAAVLMAAAVLCVVGAYALHRRQKVNRAIQARPLGEAAYAQQDWDAAADQLGNYLVANGNDVEALVKYADAQLKRRPQTSSNVNQAVTAYREVLRLDSRHREATQRLVEIYLGGMPGEAELIAGRYLEFTDDVVIRRMRADALTLQRKPKEAVAELTTILEKHPEDVLSYERMGLLAEQNPGLVSQPAATWYDEAVARNPQSALAYILRAGFHLQQSARSQAAADQAQARRERERALADLEQAQKCDFSDTETELRLVAGLMGANLLDKAQERLLALQAKDPKEVSLWRCRADLALRANSDEEMYTVAKDGLKVLAAQPWDFMPAAAELLIRSNHVEEANECISRMRQKDINPPMVALLEGFLAEKQGRLRDAIAAWRKAVTLGYRKPIVRLQLARALSRSGDIPSAIGQLRILVADEPGSVEGHLTLAQLLAQIGNNWPEVQNLALRIQQLSPDQPEALLLGLQARVEMLAADVATPAEEREKSWQEIETRLAALGTKDAGNAAVKLLQTRVAMLRRKLPEAALLLKDLEARDPNHMRVALLRADLCEAQGQKAEAKTRWQNAVARFPQAADPVRGLAFFLARQNQREECEKVLREGIARVKEPSARRDLGLLLAGLYGQEKEEGKLSQWLNDLAAEFPGDIQVKRALLAREEVVKDARRAQAIVEEIHALEGEEGWQWRYEQARLWSRGSEQDFKTRYPQVVKLLQENLQTNSRDHASRLLLAETYERTNELPLAVSAYRELQNLLPDNLLVLVRTAMVLNRVKEYGEVRRLLDQADQKNLHDPVLEKLRLEDNYRLGKTESVGKTLEKMIQEDPNDVSPRLNLALVRMQEKKYEEAQRILDDLKAKMPDSLQVMGVQISLHLQQRNAGEALRLCDQAVEKLHSAAAYTLRAQTYVALKQNEKALEDYGRIIDLDPKQARSWAVRADFLRLIGRPRDGIVDIQQALALAPDDVAIQRLAATLFLASGDASLVGSAETIVDKALAAFEKPPAANTEAPRTGEYTQLRLLKVQLLML
jgi:tetratricopeptide (TPR) repeat protein